MSWVKILIISITLTSNTKSGLIYLYNGVNSEYTSDTLRIFSDVKYRVGDSIEVRIYPKRNIQK
jgi:hypothetical protein